MINNRPFFKYALVCGLIVAAIPILYSVILLLSGKLMEYSGSAPGRPFVTPAYLLVLPAMISVAIYKYRKENGSFLKLKEAIFIGCQILLVTVVLIIGYDILFNTLLAPSFYESYYELHEPQMLEEFMELRDNDEAPLEEFKDVKNGRIQHLFWSLYTVDIVWGIIMWLMSSTIAGLIMKKKKNKCQRYGNTKIITL